MRGANDGTGLIVEEAAGADLVSELCLERVCEVFDRGELFEEPRGYFVHAFVGALRGQYRRHQQLPGIFMMQSTGRFGEKLVEFVKDTLEPGSPLGRVLRLRHLLRRRDRMQGRNAGNFHSFGWKA